MAVGYKISAMLAETSTQKDSFSLFLECYMISRMVFPSFWNMRYARPWLVYNNNAATAAPLPSSQSLAERRAECVDE